MLSLASLIQLGQLPAMFDSMGMILPIWFEQLMQQQVDLLNSILVPFGVPAMAPVDFGVDYDPAALPNGSLF